MTESDLSAEASVTTILPAPTNLTVDSVVATGADLSWTSNTTDATDHRIEVREDNTGLWEVAATVGGDAESASVTGLLNGQLYGLRVVALASDSESVDYDPDVESGETFNFEKPHTNSDVFVNSGVVSPADAGVASGDTLVIPSGETYTFAKPHENAGAVDNRGEMTPADTQ